MWKLTIYQEKEADWKYEHAVVLMDKDINVLLGIVRVLTDTNVESKTRYEITYAEIEEGGESE